MASVSKYLTTARKNKADEFYTRYDDIEKEVNEYLKINPDIFKDKCVMCPCDNPEWSNFVKFFVNNFEKFGLKKLICTCYIEDTSEGLFSINGEDETKNGRIFILNKGDVIPDSEHIPFSYLKTDGDFSNVEITKLRNEADIIVTNPPFSLFRKFIKCCQPEKRKILLIGNINGCSYKEVFNLFKSDQIWFGVTGFSKGMYFYVPDDYEYKPTYKFLRELDGKRVMRVAGVCWFTNIEHNERYRGVELVDIDISEYRKYDRFDAIDIPNVSMIPNNYFGIMGVPITFLNKYNPRQFEILGMDTEMEDNVLGGRLTIDGKTKYARIIIKRKED